jgi:hypothetical protein
MPARVGLLQVKSNAGLPVLASNSVIALADRSRDERRENTVPRV